MTTHLDKLTYRYILIFWLPLLATLFMMQIEAPFLASIMARLADPKYNLAAFGVAYSLAMLCESPVIMFTSASNALVRDKDSFIKMRNFAFTVSAACSIILLVMLIPFLFRLLTEVLMGLPEDIVALTYTTCVILIPWPAAIGYRRFYQGILIRNRLTRRVTYGTIIRLCTMTVSAFLLYLLDLPGAYVGSAAISVGVCVEALASRLLVQRVIRNLLNEDESSSQGEALTYGSITRFYAPLAVGLILNLGIRPIVTFFMVKSRFAIESLAVYPVLHGLVSILFTFGWSFHETCIALLGPNFEHVKKLKRFALGLGIFSFGVLAMIAFTPLSQIWYHVISGLTDELTSFAIRPTQVLFLIPLLMVIVCFQQAILVAARHTEPIIKSTAIELVTIIVVLAIGIHFYNMIGIVAASAALLMGKLLCSLYLVRPVKVILQAKVSGL